MYLQVSNFIDIFDTVWLSHLYKMFKISENELCIVSMATELHHIYINASVMLILSGRAY